MAQLGLAVVGAAIGTVIAPGYGTALGFSLGAAAGGALFPQHTTVNQAGPQLGDLTVANASYGQPLPRAFGRVGIAGNYIWQRPLVAVTTTSSESSGGKGGPSVTTNTTSTAYFLNVAIGVCDCTGSGPIKQFGRIWANGNIVRDAVGNSKYGDVFTLYLGSEEQLPDPTIEAAQGVGATPAFRGTAYVVVRDLPVADFGNTGAINWKIEVVTTDNATLVFDNAFVSWDDHVAGDLAPEYRNFGRGADIFGQFVVSYAINGGRAICYAQNGSVVWDLDTAAMADLVDAYIGDALVDRTILTTGIIAPVFNGGYLVMTFEASGPDGAHFFQWVAVLQPVASGSPTVLGVVRYSKPVTGAPYGTPLMIDLAGAQTTADPILMAGYHNTGAATFTLVELPSLDNIVSGFFNSGSTFAAADFQVPYLPFSTIVDDDFAQGLLAQTEGSGNANRFGGFALPIYGVTDPDTGLPAIGTYYFIYLNRGYMDYARDHTAGLAVPVEVKNVLQPAHPYGCVVNLYLGVLNFETDAGSTLTPVQPSVASYTVTDDLFTDLILSPVLPFREEYTNLTDGSAQTAPGDTFQMQPAYFEARADGSFLVGFAMQGVADSNFVHNDTEMLAKLRLFSYNPRNGRFTQIAYASGALYAGTDVGLGGTGNAGNHTLFLDDNQQTYWRSGSTLYVWGHIGGSVHSQAKGAYFTRFGTIGLDADIGLDTIVGRLSNQAGMTDAVDFDASALATQRVKGYVIGRQSTAAAAVKALQDVYLFDGVESDGKLKYAFRGGTPIAAIAEDDLATTADGSIQPKATETRTQELELPRQVVINYIDGDADYQVGSQQYTRPAATMRSGTSVTVAAPVVMTGAEALDLAQRALYLAWITRANFQVALPPSYLLYDAADVLTLTRDGASVPVYFTEAQFGADNVISAKGVSIDAVVLESTGAAGAGGGSSQTGLPAVQPTTLRLLDLPALRDVDDNLGFYAVACGTKDSWRGAAIYTSRDNATFAFAFRITAPAPIGAADTVLAAAEVAAEWDDTNTVDATFVWGSLSSVSDLDALNYANLLIVGDELVIARNATLLGSTTEVDGSIRRQYRFSRLIRGRKGTEAAMATHVMGERVALLSPGSTKRILDASSDRGVTRYWKAVTFGESVDDVTSQSFVDSGASLMPYSPVQLAGTRDGSNNLTATWVRRARIYNEWTDGTDVPLDEPVELYEVDVILASVVVRTITGTASGGGSVVTSSGQTALYTAADQTADGITPGDPVDLRVYQISSRVGRGFPGEATV